jgi:hypothetical protein
LGKNLDSKPDEPEHLTDKRLCGKNGAVDKMNKHDYLARLQEEIEQLHDCSATWRKTVPVHENSQGKVVWKGDVEVFDLHYHDKAKCCYAWNRSGGKNDGDERFVVVLEMPPILDAITAVRYQIDKDVKEVK